MSWGISQNATEKEKIFADFNDSLKGMNSADGLAYRHYSKIWDFGRQLANKEYEQGRADAVDEELYEYAFWLFTNYSGGGAVGGSVAHDNAVKSIEEFKQWQKEKEKENE